ncbi:hypothetical protein NDU88_006411 [Pleurodeles waltl]|uniref:Uncharacterized protein n=1 Tax=Pleurodeles waltl TaxID=8319 RepID=A0AAV7RPF8_PLEWA|nr:hypothetical protein NDU88_006411 [Pleurodeles waltl]
MDFREFRELAEMGSRVFMLKNNEIGWGEKIEHQRQEVVQLQEQHMALQAHLEDLENCSHARVRTGAEATDISDYIKALFHQILDSQSEPDVQRGWVHRVGLTRVEGG